MKKIILCLNENPVPPLFTRATIAAKEVRLRAALPQIDEVHLVARRGWCLNAGKPIQTSLEEKITVHLLPPWPYYLSVLPLFLFGLYYALKLKPLTVEAESPLFSGPAAIVIAKLTGAKSILELRASYVEIARYRFPWLPLKFKETLVNRLQLFFYRHADAVIANSHAYQKLLRAAEINSTVINPGLQYAPGGLKPSALPKNPSGLVIGFLGRLVPEKGVGLLIKAVKILSRKSGLPPFRVEIAGDGPSRQNLESLTAHLQLKHLVNFLGQTPNYATLAHWDILVNPCLVNHPLEMVNAEAAHMGVPVVCFGNQEIPETVTDGVTGIHVGQKSATALAQALSHLLLYPQTLAAMKLKGPVFARGNYAFSSQVDRLQALYQLLAIY